MLQIFIKKIILFCTPFLLWFALIFTIDPFNVFDISHLIPTPIKAQIAQNTTQSLNTCLYKVAEVTHQHPTHLLLGDSRPLITDTAHLHQITHTPYYNFSLPAGHFQSLIQSFWYAAQQAPPKAVYMGVGFHTYDNSINYNLLDEPITLTQKKHLYLISPTVVYAAARCIYATFFGKKIDKKTPDKDKFWQTLLKNQQKRYQNPIQKPQQYYQELIKIRDYCQKNNIALYLINYPTHTDLQKIISQTQHQAQYQDFINDMTTIAPLYHFDFDNPFTQNANLFTDPLHPNAEFMQKISNAVWNNQNPDSIMKFYPKKI